MRISNELIRVMSVWEIRVVQHLTRLTGDGWAKRLRNLKLTHLDPIRSECGILSLNSSYFNDRRRLFKYSWIQSELVIQLEILARQFPSQPDPTRLDWVPIRSTCTGLDCSLSSPFISVELWIKPLITYVEYGESVWVNSSDRKPVLHDQACAFDRVKHKIIECWPMTVCARRAPVIVACVCTTVQQTSVVEQDLESKMTIFR
jgi:hypothetical protein